MKSMNPDWTTKTMWLIKSNQWDSGDTQENLLQAFFCKLFLFWITASYVPYFRKITL